GTYTSSQGAGSFIVRVVGRTVASSRVGYSPGLHFPVSTYRTNASSGVALGVANEIGGHLPNLEDAANASGASQLNPATFAFQIGPGGAAQDGAPVTLATSSSSVTGVDFGFNFSTIVNANPSGTGSFQQFVINANGLLNGGLAQEGFAPGTEHAIFMISNGTNAPGLRAALNYLTGGVATIMENVETPLLVPPVVIDGTLQAGFTNHPMIAINGSGVGPSNGLTVLSGNCELRGLILGAFDGSAISVESPDARINGCWIGVDPTGSGAWANSGDGITVWSARAVIGGPATGD